MIEGKRIAEIHFGQCVRDAGKTEAETNSSADCARVNVTRFVENDARMRSHDNLDFQPGTGNKYVIEDDTLGAIWACLPDGTDRDLRGDSCVSMLTINDPSAEPTGFIFDGTGRVGSLSTTCSTVRQPAALLDTTSQPGRPRFIAGACGSARKVGAYCRVFTPRPTPTDVALTS